MSGAQVQAGVARTGKWWGHQHVSGEAVEPDILIFAKGIASGFPFAGMLLACVIPGHYKHSPCPLPDQPHGDRPVLPVLVQVQRVYQPAPLECSLAPIYPVSGMLPGPGNGDVPRQALFMGLSVFS